MEVQIYSREGIEKLLEGDFPQNVSVISFSEPPGSVRGKIGSPVEYSGKTDWVFRAAIHDIDIEILPNYGMTYETYFPEAEELAAFIYDAYGAGRDIICQCEYGQSRSAGCAAAILEHFFHTGISVFADYRYYPNQVVFHKVLDALEKRKGKL